MQRVNIYVFNSKKNDTTHAAETEWDAIRKPRLVNEYTVAFAQVKALPGYKRTNVEPANAILEETGKLAHDVRMPKSKPSPNAMSTRTSAQSRQWMNHFSDEHPPGRSPLTRRPARYAPSPPLFTRKEERFTLGAFGWALAFHRPAILPARAVRRASTPSRCPSGAPLCPGAARMNAGPVAAQSLARGGSALRHEAIYRLSPVHP